jgi:hypothetical protein
MQLEKMSLASKPFHTNKGIAGGHEGRASGTLANVTVSNQLQRCWGQPSGNKFSWFSCLTLNQKIKIPWLLPEATASVDSNIFTFVLNSFQKDVHAKPGNLLTKQWCFVVPHQSKF